MLWTSTIELRRSPRAVTPRADRLDSRRLTIAISELDKYRVALCLILDLKTVMLVGSIYSARFRLIGP